MLAPSHTLLIHTAKVIARVDLTGPRQLRLRNCWMCPASESLSLPAIAATALKLGPRRAGRVWMFSTDFWTEPVTLPPDLCAMLSGHELLQALALEAEAHSGISAFDSQVAASPIRPSQTGRSQNSMPTPGEGAWWVTQIPTADVDQLSQAVRAGGARLAGLAHPAAGYLASSGDEAQPSNLATWCGQSQAMKLDCDADVAATSEAWQELVDQWRHALSRRAAAAPLVVATAGGALTESHQLALGLGLAMLAACGAAAAHVQTHRQIARADQAIAELDSEQTALEKAQGAIKSSQARLTLLRQEVSHADGQRQKLQRDLEAAEAMHARQSLRWTALLGAVSAAGRDDCWLRQLESSPARATLTGLALDNAAAHRFASELEQTLADCGWAVLPAETTLDSNQLVAFRIVLDANLMPVRAERPSDLSRVAPAAGSPAARLAIPPFAQVARRSP